MGKRYEMVRRCAQIRSLIEENKYTKALEQIDALPLEEVGSTEDLYLFARIYEKAERMDMTKKIFYMIYERTHSRHALNRLLHLVIRLGEMEEARELFLTYEMVGGVTLDTFELRYLLAKAEGAPRSKLIEILEDLKKEEYTEEWGYQLARLYEQEGLREECIQECKDIKLWFGEGSIVDKAMELQEKCEADDWEPPVGEEIPEPEEPDMEEEFVYAAPPIDVTELEKAMAKPSEPPEVLEPEPMVTEEAVLPEPESSQQEMPLEPESVQQTDLSETVTEEGAVVSEPVVTKKDKPREPANKMSMKKLEKLLEEEPEDISERGIHYCTMKGAIIRIKCKKDAPHFVFAGGEERITLAVAKRITKELNNVGYFSAKSIVKITADKLNQLKLSEQMEKLLGGCMLVIDAPELTKETVEDIVQAIDENGDRIVVMLSGDFDEMDCFLSIYPELSEKISHKIRM
ncbi:MAG: hypothetical protein J1F22_07550 [Lachnospiraceae bacterium]|nr:hypothetical protein [Lachnospiraceae bacterium]